MSLYNLHAIITIPNFTPSTYFVNQSILYTPGYKNDGFILIKYCFDCIKLCYATRNVFFFEYNYEYIIHSFYSFIVLFSIRLSSGCMPVTKTIAPLQWTSNSCSMLRLTALEDQELNREYVCWYLQSV